MSKSPTGTEPFPNFRRSFGQTPPRVLALVRSFEAAAIPRNSNTQSNLSGRASNLSSPGSVARQAAVETSEGVALLRHQIAQTHSADRSSNFDPLDNEAPHSSVEVSFSGQTFVEEETQPLAHSSDGITQLIPFEVSFGGETYVEEDTDTDTDTDAGSSNEIEESYQDDEVGLGIGLRRESDFLEPQTHDYPPSLTDSDFDLELPEQGSGLSEFTITSSLLQSNSEPLSSDVLLQLKISGEILDSEICRVPISPPPSPDPYPYKPRRYQNLIPVTREEKEMVSDWYGMPLLEDKKGIIYKPRKVWTSAERFRELGLQESRSEYSFTSSSDWEEDNEKGYDESEEEEEEDNTFPEYPLTNLCPIESLILYLFSRHYPNLPRRLSILSLDLIVQYSSYILHNDLPERVPQHWEMRDADVETVFFYCRGYKEWWEAKDAKDDNGRLISQEWKEVKFKQGARAMQYLVEKVVENHLWGRLMGMKKHWENCGCGGCQITKMWVEQERRYCEETD